MIKENTGVRQVLGKVVKKRRRQSTPVEHLDDVRRKSSKQRRLEPRRGQERRTKLGNRDDKREETHQNNPTMAAIADQMQRERYCPAESHSMPIIAGQQRCCYRGD
jgi:hypothetical protein